MAARKAKIETSGGDVSEARAKSVVVEIDSKSEGTSFDPSYKAITQQIAYLMSVITNQNNLSQHQLGGSHHYQTNEGRIGCL